MDDREEIKQKIDIIELVSSYVPLKKAGRNYKGLCPFHSEKTPSFMVSPELQIYKCFGCQKGGDIFSFLMDIEGMDFAESLKTLAERAGVKLKSFAPSPAQKEKEELYTAAHLVSQFYHYILVSHDRGEPGRRFLKTRGINKASIDAFQLGFAPDSPTLIFKNLITKNKLDADTVIKAGISYRARRGELIDRFYGRVIFPLFDHRGQVVGLTGRLLPGDTRDTGKYINTPETLIYSPSSRC
jgi:DNA primase